MNALIWKDSALSLELDARTVFNQGQVYITISGEKLSPARVENGASGESLTFYFDQVKVQWKWQIKFERNRLIVQSQLINSGSQDLSLGSIIFLDTVKSIIGNLPAHEIVALGIPYGEFYPYRNVWDVRSPAANRKSTIKTQFFDHTSQSALQVGFLTYQRILTFIHYDATGNAGLTRLIAGCDFAGWMLKAGTKTKLEEFTVALGDNPFQQLEEWATLASNIIKPKFRHKPALGWLGWSWVDSINSSETAETTTCANVQAIAEKLKGFELEYVWTSISNIEGGNPGDWLNWNYRNFPGGMKKLVANLQKHGIKLGLWCGPFMISSALKELVAELDDALLRRADGSLLVYYSPWSHGDAGRLPREERPEIYALDPTHPKAQSFVRKTFQAYRKQGVRYYMIDFLEAGAGLILRHPYGGHFDKNMVAGPEAFSAMMKVIREAAGEDTFLLSSTGPMLHVAGYVDAVRVGNDFGEGRPISRDAYFYPASFVINGSYTAAAHALNAAASNYYSHGKLYLNDSGNVLTVDQPIPLEQARIHATIHALSGASSMLGDDIRHINPERLNLIKKTLPRSTAVALPLDLFSSLAPKTPTVFHRHIEQPWGDYHLLAIYNMTNAAITRKVKFSELKMNSETKCQVWEFWNEAYAECAIGQLEVEIPPESVRVYRLTEEQAVPQIIGTDMHLIMGEQEIGNCVWNKKNLTLEIEATRVAGEVGSIFLHMPGNMRVVNMENCYIARNRDGLKGSLVIRVPLQFVTATVQVKLQFAMLEGSATDEL